MNLIGRLVFPDEVLLQDSEWHAEFFAGELDQALCRPAPDLWPILEKIGVRRLSKSARVSLEFVDGPEADESAVADKLVIDMQRVGAGPHPHRRGAATSCEDKVSCWVRWWLPAVWLVRTNSQRGRSTRSRA